METHFRDTHSKKFNNVSDWCISNKLSLNVEKTKYSLYLKPRRAYDLPLKLSKLSINKQEIKRAS